MARPLWAVAGVALLFITGGVGILIASSGGEEEAVQRAVTSSPGPSSSPVASVSPVPSGFPSSREGYIWFAADPSSPEPYAAQIPKEWEQRRAGGRIDFVPPGTLSNFPYSDVPRLTLMAGGSTGPWAHPFQIVVGRQGGGGCRGDVNDGAAEPSSKRMIGTLEWEFFEFDCTEVLINYRPSVTYHGQASEAHIGDKAISMVLIQSPDQPFPSQILEQPSTPSSCR